VSAAASKGGSVAGSIAKMKGAHVIGIAGSPDKVCVVVRRAPFGVDAASHYKRGRTWRPAQGARAQRGRICSTKSAAELIDKVSADGIAMQARTSALVAESV